MPINSQGLNGRAGRLDRFAGTGSISAVFISLFLLFGISVQASPRDEWTFQGDSKGCLLANAVNSGTDGSVFASGGIGVLEASGLGSLLSTPSANLWENGVELDASLASATTRYLRYDLDYDLSSGSNTVGTSVGIFFVDAAGINIAGFALAYDPTHSAPGPAGRTMTPVVANLDLTGTLSAIAKVDTSANEITVWYDLTGENSFVEGSPATNVAISITSIEDLRIQATGEASGEPNDFVAVENIRVADSWADITKTVEASFDAKYLNEWVFDRDPASRTLAEAQNTGTDGAIFSADSIPVTQTDGLRGLICSSDVPGIGDFLTDGAILTADVQDSVANETRFLRYDFDYDLTAAGNDSGSLLGLFFTDGTSTNLAGVALKYDVGTGATLSPGVTESEIVSELELIGSLSVIAKVNLSNSTMEVWYDLSGNNAFTNGSPDTTVGINLASIDELQFRATGDLIASTNEAVVVDNIRTASSWDEIATKPEDLLPPPELSITVSDTSSGAMLLGETNVYSVVISNSGGSAIDVTSLLTHDGLVGDFTMTSNNTPVFLGNDDSVTNTYEVIGNTKGFYVFSAQAISATTNSAATNFNLTVGSSISYLSNSIVEVSGGLIDGKYEPGETLDITVYSINDGGRVVSNVLNTLSPDLTKFSAPDPVSAVYPVMAVGAITSTTYRITVNGNTPSGTYSFGVTNQGDGETWPDSFPLTIFSEAIPSVSPLSVVLRAVEGGSDIDTVTITNSGNAPFNFSITDDSAWGIAYVEEEDDINFSTSAQTPITLNGSYPETGGVSDAIELGFNFPLYGASYNRFYVTSDGVIGLSNSTNTPVLGDGYGTLPAGDGHPLIAPFWSSLRAPEGSIFCEVEASRVVISYVGVDKLSYGGTALEFQTILYVDGRIEFRYNEINGDRLDRVTVGVQGDSDQYINLSMTPASDASVLLTPQEKNAWVTYLPQSGTIDPMSSMDVAFILHAGQPLGSQNNFTAHFDWIPGGSADVTVDAEVVPAVPEYSAASSLTFSGPAGEITTTSFIITNSGTGPLDFGITDSDSTVTRFAQTDMGYDWINISSIGTEIVLNDPGSNPYVIAEDEGFSDWLPIGFSFPFIGNSYNQFVASANGSLRLDSTGRVYAVRDMRDTLLPNQLIVPYGGDLVIDENATLKAYATAERLVVTWENVRQYGLNGGGNLTFQVILEPSGKITCQYKLLEGHQWPKTVVAGWRDVISGTAQFGDGSIIQPSDGTPITNEVSGVVSTQYVDSVSERILALEPYETRVIRYNPASGSILPGDTAEITIIGDASNQSQGGNDAITNTLTISHNALGSPNTLDVIFAATNSQETVFVPLAAANDSDGDGVADDAERIAGSDPQDADSLFTPAVTRSPAGPVLSWNEPLDGVQRIYKIYWTDDLTGSWAYLDTVTNGTSYLDIANSNEPVIYYKVTAE